MALKHDQTANIKSCSKSILGLLLGAAIDKGQISSVKLPLSQVMPDLLPEDVAPEVANITLEELVTLTAPLESTSIRNYGRWVNSSNWIDYVLTRPASDHRSGTMVRDDGAFAGKQVISKEWLTASVIPRTHSRYSGLGYGYGWFLSESGYMIARGYGGQIIAANRQKNIAVAITSDPTQPARSDGYFGDLMRLLEGPVLELA